MKRNLSRPESFGSPEISGNEHLFWEDRNNCDPCTDTCQLPSSVTP